MCCDYVLRGKASLSFQRVYILCKAPQQKALLMQQRYEVVSRCRLEISRKELLQSRDHETDWWSLKILNRYALRTVLHLGKLIEGLWVAAKVVKLKDCLRMRQIILLQVVVEPSLRTPKVWNACRFTYNCCASKQV